MDLKTKKTILLTIFVASIVTIVGTVSHKPLTRNLRNLNWNRHDD